MTTFRKASLRVVALAAVVFAGPACESSSMDKDLKRTADRATIRLSRAESERDAAKAQLAKVNVELAEVKAQQAEDLKIRGASGDRAARFEAELLQARQRIRELEEAASSARQGMPTTRRPQP